VCVLKDIKQDVGLNFLPSSIASLSSLNTHNNSDTRNPKNNPPPPKKKKHRDSRYLHNEPWTSFKEVHERKRLSDQVSSLNNKRLSAHLFHWWESLSERTECNTVTFIVNAIFRRYVFVAGGNICLHCKQEKKFQAVRVFLH